MRNPSSGVTRRGFGKGVGLGVAALTLPQIAWPARAKAAGDAAVTPENLVKKLYESFDDRQKSQICFPWDHSDGRGLLRLHVSNNWQITKPSVTSGFFTEDQQEMIEAIFFGLYHPEWHGRIRKQLKDDAGGYGVAQSIAVFGDPSGETFELVMTGRHLTIRCDGNSTPHFAFGGPIFYGHAAQGFDEKPDHPGNVFWEQALKANRLYEMLDGKQRESALVEFEPAEDEVHHRGKTTAVPGIPVTELTGDQKAHLAGVLKSLVEPYREADRAEVDRCLEAQGGLDACKLAFYSGEDLGDDEVWDNWRLEGPSFVWYFRGAPHVHVWVNVADDASTKITTAG